MPSAEYRVQLESFEGPLDLLLHLIRKAEVDIHDIPIAIIADQYLGYLEAFDIDRVDIDLAGEFLVMASTLMEIKSRVLARQVLSAGEEPAEAAVEDTEDPRVDLVRQLLEYRRYRDAADELAERRDEWSRTRPAGAASVDNAELRRAIEDTIEGSDVDELDLGALVQAYRVIASTVNFERLGEHEVIADETPIELYAADLSDRLTRDGGPQRELSLVQLLEGRSRREMLGLFLALLDLIKDQRVRARQDDDTILVALRDVEPAGEDAQQAPFAG